MGNESVQYEYQIWLKELKMRIRETQVRAVVAANSELILLYWQIGREILERQSNDMLRPLSSGYSGGFFRRRTTLT